MRDHYNIPMGPPVPLAPILRRMYDLQCAFVQAVIDGREDDKRLLLAALDEQIELGWEHSPHRP